jgi:hypothetical protein
MMETLPNGVAPMPNLVIGGRPYRVGAKGGRVAQAWQWMWDNMSPTEYTEGRELAERAAARFDLMQSSLLTHLSRMVRDGKIEVDYRYMPFQARRLKANGEMSTFTTRQKCAFYRIKR